MELFKRLIGRPVNDTGEDQEEREDTRYPVVLGPAGPDGRRPLTLKESDDMTDPTPTPYEPMPAEEYNRKAQAGEDPLLTTDTSLPAPTATGSAAVPNPNTIDPGDLHPTNTCTACGQRIPTDAEIVAATLDLVKKAGVATQVVPYFYNLLFTRWRTLAEKEPNNPRWNRLLSLFSEDMTGQHERLLTAIITVCEHYGDDETNSDDPEMLERTLIGMGRAHVRFDLEVSDYADVGTALMFTLQHFAGDQWTPVVRAAWKRVYKYMAGKMLDGESRPNHGGAGRRRANR